MEQKRKINSSNKYIGVEGVFYKKEGQASFRTFKKSMTLKVGRNFLSSAKENLKKRARALSLDFVGISDIFNVDGQPSHRAFLGRTAYYDFNSIKKAKELLGDFDYQDLKPDSSIFFVSLIYFIKDKPAKDSFSLIYNIGVESSGRKLKDKVTQIGNSENTKRAIVKSSLDITDTKDIHFIGVRWIEKIESDLFDSSEAIFKTKKNVLKEIEPIKNIEKKLLHLLENDIRLHEK
jgi:hypothetical protein